MIQRYEHYIGTGHSEGLESMERKVDRGHNLYPWSWCKNEDVEKLEQELAEVKAANRWRDVKEELPEMKGIQQYIIRHRDGGCNIATWSRGSGTFWVLCLDLDLDDITHWMPLPELKDSGVTK